jgi:ATP-binding protein involved in chromosome partitioning
MFKKVNVPILGIIENMSYFLCTECNTKHPIFGHGGAKIESEKLGVPFLGEIPLDMTLRSTSDEGTPILVNDPKHPISNIYFQIADEIIKSMAEQSRPSPVIVQ